MWYSIDKFDANRGGDNIKKGDEKMADLAKLNGTINYLESQVTIVSGALAEGENVSAYDARQWLERIRVQHGEHANVMECAREIFAKRATRRMIARTEDPLAREGRYEIKYILSSFANL